MRYVTTFEKRGIEKGIEKGIERGVEQGIEQGASSHKASLNTILQLRFGKIPAATNSAIEKINELETLKNLVINAAVTESLEGFQEYLKSIAKTANKVSEPVASYTPARKPRAKKQP